LAVLLVFRTFSFSINLPEKLTNTVFTDQIKTVQLYPSEESLSSPVIELNSDQRLHFSFDDLSNEVKNLYYTIYHCDRNWKLSRIPQQEYLESFVDFPLEDYEVSINTKVKYLNYQLELPNEDIPLKYSGNYVLVVFDKDNQDEPLITWRFFVVEQVVDIDARIRSNLFNLEEGKKQEVDFVIRKNGMQIKNSRTDIKVVIAQNNRFDNAISNVPPLLEDETKLEYDYDNEINFTGDNEYRQFEFRSYNFPGKNVADVSFHEPFYHITLEPDHLRVQERYTFDREINGMYRVEMYKSEYPEIEADYMFVHFTLKMDQVLAGGGVYVFGALSSWECNKMNEMKWDMEKHQYELTLLLKQGFYNYCYAWKDFKENRIKVNALEGSFAETENDYQLFVYYGKITDRYDRLIGYDKFNSLVNRSYLN
jgi:hypothetical protein